MANLRLHQGAQLVNREELWRVETPPATRSWQPISHGHLLHTVHQQLQQADYAVTSESHGLSRDTKRYFGLLEVRGRNPTRDFRTVVGIRNAHDKSFPAGLCLGTCVLVCDNLSFSGELTLARRHTRHILRDLVGLVRDAICKFQNLREQQEARIGHYKARTIRDRTAHDVIVQAIDQRIVPVTTLPVVLCEWRTPAHPAFAEHGKSLWRLQNAFTESWKGSNLHRLPRRSQRLQSLLDRVAGYPLPG